MNLSTFWKKKTLTVELYMKSGNVIVLDKLESFTVSTNSQNGKISRVEWKFTEGAKQRLLDIHVDEIEAIIQRYRP